MSIDYDLFVINPDNKDTTPEEFRDCVFDALNTIDDRLRCIEIALREKAERYDKIKEALEKK